ncbi:phytanoyl-CoA dioxygenase family protein [Fuerstiella marisgermanici]|uniref:Ectoine hydroxylase n=1 Tax=Fuerstiella marisgermanici TaxID=1891926 RepID=A0A1P8WJW5_9PLAN|nr:phytanoyl-CoA dioxygenase family protein [Fuerstiella marisgermanici]APZ94341.1 ectoine hydroxylase [Fuerstiella marisgermanici]
MQDLAEFSEPVSDLFSSDAVNAPRLSDEAIQRFERDGFVVGPRLLDDRQTQQLRDELAELTDPEHAGRELWYEYNSNESADPNLVLFHALGAWRLRPGFHDALWNPAFTVPASQLLGGDVRFWHDQLFCKPAKHGGVVAWHQDYSYWTRTKPMAHLTCWVGLDDASVDNGCIHYVPGSHKWNLLPVTGLAGDMTAIKDALNDEQWELFNNPVAVELKAGECVFHHPLTVHGSFENRTDRPRRAMVLNVVKDGVCSDSDQPLLNGTDVVPPGQPLGGKFFPLLFKQ